MRYDPSASRGPHRAKGHREEAPGWEREWPPDVLEKGIPLFGPTGIMKTVTCKHSSGFPANPAPSSLTCPSEASRTSAMRSSASRSWRTITPQLARRGLGEEPSQQVQAHDRTPEEDAADARRNHHLQRPSHQRRRAILGRSCGWPVPEPLSVGATASPIVSVSATGVLGPRSPSHA